MRKKLTSKRKIRPALVLASKRNKSNFYYFLGLIFSRNRPDKMAQQVRLFAAIPDTLSPIPRSYTVENKNNSSEFKQQGRTCFYSLQN